MFNHNTKVRQLSGPRLLPDGRREAGRGVHQGAQGLRRSQQRIRRQAQGRAPGRQDPGEGGGPGPQERVPLRDLQERYQSFLKA